MFNQITYIKLSVLSLNCDVQNKRHTRANQETSKLDSMAESEDNEDVIFFLNADSEPLN